jgi:uncharacterized membrane protein YphA (DoxX/SURF4 family)
VIGGFLIAVGLATRPAALLPALHFAVAAFVSHQSFPVVDLQIARLLMWVLAVIAAVGGAGSHGIASSYGGLAGPDRIHVHSQPE